MMFRILGFVCIFLCTGCNAGNSLMENYNVDADNKKLIGKLGKSLASNDLNEAKNFIKDENFNINMPDKDGRTLLIASIMSENYAITEKLLKLGANPNFLHDTYKSKSAMGWAAAYKDDSYLKLLLQYDGDVNLLNEKQRPYPYPIYNAIAVNSMGNLRFLIENGANTDVVDKTGLTPIMLASTAGKWEMIMMMLEAGADISFKNKWGEDAASYIEDAGLGTVGKDNEWRKKVVQFIESKGVKLKLRIPL